LNIRKNIARKVDNYISKAGLIIGRFIGRHTPIVHNIGNFTSSLQDKRGAIGKTINDIAGSVYSVTRMFPTGL
jgi:hypothetical protein